MSPGVLTSASSKNSSRKAKSLFVLVSVPIPPLATDLLTSSQPENLLIWVPSILYPVAALFPVAPIITGIFPPVPTNSYSVVSSKYKPGILLIGIVIQPPLFF